MMRSYESKISNMRKISSQKYTKQNPSHTNSTQPDNQKELHSARSSQLSINQVITPRINIYEYKQKAAFFIRNSIRSKLRKAFHRMLSRFMFRKVCFKLIKSKGKRDMEQAFLTIRNYTQRSAQNVINQFYHRLPEIRIFTAIFNKIMAKPNREVITRIRAYTKKKRLFQNFTKILFKTVQKRFMKGASIFYTEISLQAGKIKQKQSVLELVMQWGQYIIKNQLRQSFLVISQLSLINQWNEKSQQVKEKQQKVMNNLTNRKQTITKLRQDLKAAKNLVDQQKLAKNKVYQQHKKYIFSNKIEMTENVRKYEKELKVEEASYKNVQDEFKQWQRLAKIRKQISDKGVGSESRCFELYSQLLKYPDAVVKQLHSYVPELKRQVNEFKQEQVYLFLMNLRMAKLVDLYQKREIYNYQAQYYELQYQNNVIRETIRCFIREKYEAFISMKRWESTRHKTLQDSN